MTHYDLLEVSPSASPEVIRAAYKSLIQRYHPDKNPGNPEAAHRAARVVQAYEALSDVGQRAVYDSQLAAQVAQVAQASPVSAPATGAYAKARHAQGGAAASRAPGRWGTASAASSWPVWLIIGVIVVAGGLIVLLSKKTPPAAQSAPKQDASEIAQALAARTVTLFETALTVNLKVPVGSADPGHTLTIPVLIARVGTIDADKASSYLESQKELISQKVAEALSTARYDELIKIDGEPYLKKLILDSIGQTTGTNRFKDYPGPNGGPPGRYGVIDVLLPASFSVK